MQHPITPATRLVVLAEDYDYLSAGVRFLATPGKQYVRFDREDGSSGTFLQMWQWKRLLNGTAGARILPVEG